VGAIVSAPWPKECDALAARNAELVRQLDLVNAELASAQAELWVLRARLDRVPKTADEVRVWAARHGLGLSAGVGAAIGALRRDLLRTELHTQLRTEDDR